MESAPGLDLKTTKWDVDDGVATLTLSRPDSHNAWTGRMHTELRHLLYVGESDPDVHVIIITGDPAGRSFCPGGDAKALAGHAERGGYDAGTPDDLANPGYGVRAEFDADFAYMLGLETTVIAAVNGAAAGVGFALTCWCDVRIVDTAAKLTSAHGKLNLPAEYGLSWILPRLIGRSAASDILLTSRIVTGAEAAKLGLAIEAVANTDVLPAAMRYARNLIDTISPHSLRATKRQLSIDALHGNPADAVRAAQRQLEQMMTESNYREGATALNERRAPRWK